MAVQLEHFDGIVVCPKCGWSKPDTRNWRHVCRPKGVAVRREPGEHARAVQHGPGTELQKIIRKRLGQQSVGGCGCGSMVRQMNEWGPSGCRDHLAQIVERLVKIATDRQWLIEPEEGEAVNPADVGKPVPLTRRTRWMRALSRAVARVPAGETLIEWSCRRMVLLAIGRAERTTNNRGE